LEPTISVEEEIISKVLKELGSKLDEKASCSEVTDPVCINNVLTKMNNSEELQRIKNEIAEAFVISSWTQRIYFDVRSIMMTIFGAIITFLVFWRVGTVNVFGDFALGFATYFVALVLSRLIDSRIVKMSRGFLRFSDRHKRLRNFIVKTF